MNRLTLPSLLLAAAALAGCVTPVQEAAPASPLTPSAWVVHDLAGQAPPGSAGPALTLAFEADGHVSGFSGCNRFAGQATIEGARLTFSPLIMTRMACTDPVRNAEEALYVGLLQQAASWSIDAAGTLAIVSAGAKAPSHFTPDKRPAS